MSSLELDGYIHQASEQDIIHFLLCLFCWQGFFLESANVCQDISAATLPSYHSRRIFIPLPDELEAVLTVSAAYSREENNTSKYGISKH